MMKQLCAALLLTLLVLYFGPASAAINQSTVQKLLAEDNAAGDHFGYSVSVQGSTAVIGAPYDDDKGSAYVFVRAADGTWSQQAKLAASDGAAEDSLGFSVSLDGGTAVIGAKNCDPVTFLCSGSAYVFVRSAGSTWNQQAKLAASGGSAIEVFLRSVSVSGNIALIGADGYDDKGFPSGAAYVFVRFPSGTWRQQAKLTAGDAAPDYYAFISVAVEGDTAVIGLVHGSESGDYSAGAAYVFVRSANGTWSQQSKLAAPVFNYFGYFGYSVSVDGKAALIGSWGDTEPGNWSGAAYVFTEAQANLPPVLPLLLQKE